MPATLPSTVDGKIRDSSSFPRPTSRISASGLSDRKGGPRDDIVRGPVATHGVNRNPHGGYPSPGASWSSAVEAAVGADQAFQLAVRASDDRSPRMGTSHPS